MCQDLCRCLFKCLNTVTEAREDFKDFQMKNFLVMNVNKPKKSTFVILMYVIYHTATTTLSINNSIAACVNKCIF